MHRAWTLVLATTLTGLACADDPKPNERALHVMRQVAAAFDASAAENSKLPPVTDGLPFAIWYPMVPTSSELIARCDAALTGSRSLPLLKPNEVAATVTQASDRQGITWNGIVDTVIQLRRIELWNAIRHRDYPRAVLAVTTLARWGGVSGNLFESGMYCPMTAREALVNALDLALAQGCSADEYAMLRGAVLSNIDREDPWSIIAPLMPAMEARAENVERWIRTAESFTNVQAVLVKDAIVNDVPLDDDTRARLLDEWATWKKNMLALTREALDQSHRAEAGARANALWKETRCEFYKNLYWDFANACSISSKLIAWRVELEAWDLDKPLPTPPASLASTVGWIDFAEAIRSSNVDDPRKRGESLPSLLASLDALPPFIRHDFGRRTSVMLDVSGNRMPLHWMAVALVELADAIRDSRGDAIISAKRTAALIDALLAFDTWGADIAASAVLERTLASELFTTAFADPKLKSRFEALRDRALQHLDARTLTLMREDMAARFARKWQRAWWTAHHESEPPGEFLRVYHERLDAMSTWTEGQVVTALHADTLLNLSAQGINPFDGVVLGTSGYRSALDPPPKHPTLPCFNWTSIVGEAQHTKLVEAARSYEAVLRSSDAMRPPPAPELESISPSEVAKQLRESCRALTPLQ